MTTTTVSRQARPLVEKMLVQILFIKGRPVSIDELRLTLRDALRNRPGETNREVASLSNFDLLQSAIGLAEQLEKVGLSLRISQGTLELVTTTVPLSLSELITDPETNSGMVLMTEPMLEVLACIVFKQPVSKAEIDRLFAMDKRSIIERLLHSHLVESKEGPEGRLRYSTTPDFLKTLGVGSVEDLKRQRGGRQGDNRFHGWAGEK
jgi:chromosome segregation and condensation protein ScpB